MTDPETGLNWASFTTERGLTFRVAVPEEVTETADFDTAFQIIAPAHLGWVGLAWGGSMTYNPLAVSWPNGQEVTVSSRIALQVTHLSQRSGRGDIMALKLTAYNLRSSFSPPLAYDFATYTVLEKGTHINATHWQVTAICSGCSRWGEEDSGGTIHLNATGQNALAFAYSDVPVHDATKNDSSFNMHSGAGHWVHDFSQGANGNFAASLAKLAVALRNG